MSGKTRTTVRISADLLAFAKETDINLSQTLESSLRRLRSERLRKHWLAENAEALEGYNERVARDGIFGSDSRRF